MTTVMTDKPSRIASTSGVPGSGGKASKGGGLGKDGKPVDDAKGGSKKKKILVVALVLLVFGGVAKFTVLAPTKSGKAATAKPVAGPVIPMDAMTLNLTDGHFLQIKLSIETVKGSPVTLDTSQASQLAIDEFSNRTMADLTGAPARTKAKNELLAKLKVAYPKQVMAVFYTGFAMQ